MSFQLDNNILYSPSIDGATNGRSDMETLQCQSESTNAAEQDSETSEWLPPKPCNLTDAAIERVAGLVAKKYALDIEDDLYGLVRALGGRIRKSSLDEFVNGEDGSIFIEKKGDFEILISPFNIVTRDRFTIAHELGHYFLHYPEVNSDPSSPMKMKAARYGRGRIEREANKFAVAFIMPEGDFRAAFKEHNGSTLMLSNVFGTSLQATEFRARNLGLI